MPALTGPQQVGVREDVADMLYLADIKDTPFTSTVKKGKAPKDPMLWEYGLKSRAARKRGGVPDGKDIDAFDSVLPRDYVQCRSEVFRRAPMVGFIAERRSTNGGVAGVNDEFDMAVADQLVELKRDIEREMCSNQDSRPDNGVDGSQTRGVGRWVWDGAISFSGKLDSEDAWSSASAYTELSVPASFRTPVAQIYTGSVASMTEAQFGALLNAKWTNTGSSSELRGFVTSAIKNAVGLFSRYQPSVGGSTSVVQTQGKYESNTLMQATVDIYKSDWGTFSLHPIPTDWMPTAYTGYFLDMSQVQLRTTESANISELPDLGGGPRKMIQTIIGLEAGDPRAHCKIDGSA